MKGFANFYTQCRNRYRKERRPQTHKLCLRYHQNSYKCKRPFSCFCVILLLKYRFSHFFLTKDLDVSKVCFTFVSELRVQPPIKSDVLYRQHYEPICFRRCYLVFRKEGGMRKGLSSHQAILREYVRRI